MLDSSLFLKHPDLFYTQWKADAEGGRGQAVFYTSRKKGEEARIHGRK